MGANLKRPKKTLRIYDRECYKLASLVYKVTKACKQQATGIELKIKKEDFYSAEIKEAKNKLWDLHDVYFEKRRRFRCIVIYAMTAFLMLGLTNHMQLASSVRSIITCTILGGFITTLILYAILYIDKDIEDRVREANKNIIKYFDSIYSSLQFAKTDGNSFFYDLVEVDPYNAEMAHFFAKKIVQRNDS